MVEIYIVFVKWKNITNINSIESKFSLLLLDYFEEFLLHVDNKYLVVDKPLNNNSNIK